MTREERARDYAEHNIGKYTNDFANIYNAYLKGATEEAKELEEENAELERKLEQTEKDLADYQFNYPTIKELQKENAELKEQIEKMKCCGKCRYFDRDEPKYCDKGVFNAYICDKWRFAND